MRSNAPPFRIVVDTREKLPYLFAGAVDGALKAGDYSVLGMEDIICVERKSVEDLFGTLGQGRKRFERELVRMADYRYKAIMIEGSVKRIMAGHPYSRMNPESVLGSLIAFSIRFNLHVFFCDNHIVGQIMTEKILKKFYDEVVKGGLECAVPQRG